MRRLGVAVVVTALLLAFGGTTALLAAHHDDPSRSLTDVPTTTPAPGATDPPRPGLRRFYDQRLSWSVCRGELLCARLAVPLDYRHPAGRTLGLAVLKVSAGEPAHRIGSLVVNPGGPGEPGTDYAAHADQAFGEPLRAAYDIVGFDPRGTGDSDPVDCLDDRQLDRYLAADPDPDTPAEAAEYERWVRRIGRGCLARSGALAAHVGTVEAARDMDVLRAALGESALTYLGASYGTELGATYAALFPRRVGRMVLDGAVDPALGARALGLQQARGFETALRSYVGDCVARGDCFLGRTVEEGVARVQRFLADVDQHPLPTSGDRRLTVGNAVYGLIYPLYSRSGWPVLTTALRAAFAGDGSLLLRISDLYTARGDEGYTDNSIEANYAIDCLDDPTSIAPARVPAEVPAYQAASPTFGRIFAWGLTTCGGLRVRAAERPPRHPTAAGAPPIVVIGTTRDPATPMVWAQRLAQDLRSGVLVRRDGDGHTGYHVGNACVDRAVEGYLVAGTVPPDGLRC